MSDSDADVAVTARDVTRGVSSDALPVPVYGLAHYTATRAVPSVRLEHVSLPSCLRWKATSWRRSVQRACVRLPCAGRCGTSCGKLWVNITLVNNVLAA